MSDEKKYEILPGVELPDMKSINEAASDFSVSGVNDIKIKSPQPTYTPGGEAADAATAAELAALQSLGDEVAANEARAAAESRARMDAIIDRVKAEDKAKREELGIEDGESEEE